MLCENCREKYVNAFRNNKQQNSRNKTIIKRKNTYTKAAVSPSSTNHIDSHIIMKNNAMFLLDLASAADTGILILYYNFLINYICDFKGITHQRRASMNAMPSLSENNSPPDLGGPFNPLPPFQCLQGLGATSLYEESPFCDEELRRKSIQDGFFSGQSSGQRVRVRR